jgi:hypothetical protein
VADEYIEAPIEFDEIELYNRGIERIQSYFPSWTPKPYGFIDIVLRTVASMAAIGAEVGSEVPSSIFRAFGPLAHDPPHDATPATATTIWTVIDQQGGYEIPAGTPVGLSLSGSTNPPSGFETVDDWVVAAGEQTVSVNIVATIPGLDTSGLDTVIRADSLPYVTGVTLTAPSAGGTDAELDPDFIDRLSSDFESWTTTPIRGIDFARKARDIIGVYRCAYWENYNPADATTDNDKYVALCPVDENGQAVSAGIQTQVSDYMESLREVNFVAPVVSPSYATVDATAVIHVLDPSDEASVLGEVESVLAEYFSPATWGGPGPIWNNLPVVRLSKVMTAIESLSDVVYADGLTIGLNGGVQAAADITMPGAFPLPQPGTFTLSAVTP